MKIKYVVLMALVLCIALGFGNIAQAATQSANVPSTREQLKDGITPAKVTCKTGHVLALKPDGMPACVSQNTADKLGWETIQTQFDYSAYKDKKSTDTQQPDTQQPDTQQPDTQQPCTHKDKPPGTHHIQKISNPKPDFNDQFGQLYCHK